MTAIVLQGDARHLPLPDASVDLIVTSPPFWGQRDYCDAGQSMPGQIGSEATWQEWLANLLDCTREWVRVLKPEGNLFVELGDKFSTASGPKTGAKSRGLHPPHRPPRHRRPPAVRSPARQSPHRPQPEAPR